MYFKKTCLILSLGWWKIRNRFLGLVVPQIISILAGYSSLSMAVSLLDNFPFLYLIEQAKQVLSSNSTVWHLSVYMSTVCLTITFECINLFSQNLACKSMPYPTEPYYF